MNRSRSAFGVSALALLVLGLTPSLSAQHSVARQWNEVLLESIRNDLARPTVHARNLFHTAVVMYDAWAAYDERAEPFLLGQEVAGFRCEFEGIPQPTDRAAARNEAISYAAYRLLRHRFQRSPGAAVSMAAMDAELADLGYDAGVTSVDYASGSPAALGNYIAQCMIAFGLQDGAN